ncbi:MAG: glucose-1-phosphate cytidylyltransferase [Anaerolineae bacterium]|jgi:glucose-1-phosphate cytidylyltransferase|nr:glucose-1-phosphate cytidylyltransferase [Anaerolineae bacterium]
MKVVILAGGFGTRLTEETQVRPKPMVEIGGRPILWHIMKHYAYYGFNEFVITLGYKGEIIKQYFIDYAVLQTDMTVDLKTGTVNVHQSKSEDWKVHLIDTGLNTMTGGRIKRVAPYLQGEKFMVTYGDGVSNINLHALLEFHNTHKCLGTVSAVRPPARFGSLLINDDNRVSEFKEKSPARAGWINGGFFVFESQFLDYLKDDTSILESDALEQLAIDKQLTAYKHEDFWQCMDTVRDMRYLESLWNERQAAWKVWEE